MCDVEHSQYRSALTRRRRLCRATLSRKRGAWNGPTRRMRHTSAIRFVNPHIVTIQSGQPASTLKCVNYEIGSLAIYQSAHDRGGQQRCITRDSTQKVTESYRKGGNGVVFVDVNVDRIDLMCPY